MNALLQRAGQLEQRFGKWLVYLVLIPFLHPRGFDESWGLYKGFFLLWLYAALVISVLWAAYDALRRGLPRRGWIWGVAAYYGLFILITLFTQKGIHEGLQKLFAAPVLYAFCYMQLKNDPKGFLRALANTLTVILGLNVTLLCPLVTDKLIGLYHIQFLGHVQIVAQFGVLGVFTGYLLYRQGRRTQSGVLAAASVLSMVFSGTAVSALVLVLLAVGIAALWLQRLSPLRRALLLDTRLYLLGSILLSAGLLLFANWELDRALGFDFSGRCFVWRAGLDRMAEQPWLGYGAYGVQLTTFWSAGMNYAHNELLQRLLDGGAVLCVAYYIMVYLLIQPVDRVRSRRTRGMGSLCLTALLLISQFESVTEYIPAAVLLCLLAELPGMGKERT